MILPVFDILLFAIPMIIVRADFPTNRRAATSSIEDNSGHVVCAHEVVINFLPRFSEINLEIEPNQGVEEIDMPIYEYSCQKCGLHLEVMQKMSDKPLTRCPECKGRLEKIFSQTSFQLKGSGWYVSDYTGRGKAEKAEKAEKPEKTDKSEKKEAAAGTCAAPGGECGAGMCDN